METITITFTGSPEALRSMWGLVDHLGSVGIPIRHYHDGREIGRLTAMAQERSAKPEFIICESVIKDERVLQLPPTYVNAVVRRCLDDVFASVAV